IEQGCFSLNPGQISDPIKTQFGYHVIQTEEKETAHTKSFNEVRGTILATMERDKEAQAAQAYAQSLANEAQKSGLAKTAAAHHLQVVATDYLARGTISPGLADSSKLMSEAFT